MRLDYSKKHHRGTYITLLTTCKLSEHLAEIDSNAKRHVRDPTKTFANTELPNGSRLKTTFCRRWRWIREMREQEKSFSERWYTDKKHNRRTLVRKHLSPKRRHLKLAWTQRGLYGAVLFRACKILDNQKIIIKKMVNFRNQLTVLYVGVFYELLSDIFNSRFLKKNFSSIIETI